MDPSEIRDLLVSQPFLPFTVYMTDGAVYNVTHPERALIGEETLVLYQNRELIRCALINMSRVVAPENAKDAS